MQNVQDMINILDDHGFEDTADATKLYYIQDAMDTINALEPWPFLEGQPVTLTFDGTHSTPLTGLPANFLSVITMVDPITGRQIMPERADNMEKEAAMMVTQLGPDPLFYYFIGDQLNFAFIPPAAFTARMRWLGYQPAITLTSDYTTILMPPRYWMAIVFYALIQLYDKEDDPEMATRFEEKFDAKIQSIREDIWKQQWDRADHVVVTDPDYLIDFPL